MKHDCAEGGDVELLVALEGRRKGADSGAEVELGSSSCR